MKVRMMLRYIYADSLHEFPLLKHSMFRDRADQFAHRLGWNVKVNALGEERDEYDDLNPLYVIWQLPDGTHGGSMRFLPTVEKSMVNDHFSHLLGGGAITSPQIWECTRFCMKRGISGQVAAALMLGGSELMENFDINHFVGVFDARMVRIYRRIGACPEILGSAGHGRERISVGLWGFSNQKRDQILVRSGIDRRESKSWFQFSFTEKLTTRDSTEGRRWRPVETTKKTFDDIPGQHIVAKIHRGNAERSWV